MIAMSPRTRIRTSSPVRRASRRGPAVRSRNWRLSSSAPSGFEQEIRRENPPEAVDVAVQDRLEIRVVQIAERVEVDIFSGRGVCIHGDISYADARLKAAETNHWFDSTRGGRPSHLRARTPLKWGPTYDTARDVTPTARRAPL